MRIAFDGELVNGTEAWSINIDDILIAQEDEVFDICAEVGKVQGVSLWLLCKKITVNGVEADMLRSNIFITNTEILYVLKR